MIESEAIKSPCNECDWHLAGESKICKKCEKCEKRIAYNNFIDELYGKIETEPDEPPLEVVPKAKEQEEASTSSRIDWEAVKAEYVKSVVEKKKTIAGLAQQFGMHIKTLYRYRGEHNWPKIKVFECKTKKCINPAEIKDRCKKCYQRIWMREKKLKNREIL